MKEEILRVRDLRGALDEVRSIFRAAGARPQEKAFEQISAAVAEHDDEPVETYFTNVRVAAEEAVAPADQRYARRLTEAGLSETAFLAVIAEMQTDRKLKKPALQKIAKAYAGSFDNRASGSKLIDEIKLAFYTKVYERDARAMARRATPV